MMCQVDFGSAVVTLDFNQAETLSEQIFLTHNGSFVHALLEWTALGVAAMTFVMALVYYRFQASLLVPTMALALLASGVIDGFHTLAATRLIGGEAPNQNLIPFTWGISRIFHVVIMMIGVLLIFAQTGRTRSEEYEQQPRALIGTGILFTAISYLVIYFCATSAQLPQTIYPDSMISRPFDVVPLILFIVTGVVLYWPLYRKQPNEFSFALLVSLAPNIATQLHMSFGSTALYDSHFNVAHFLKIVAYIVPLLGLSIDYLQQREKLVLNIRRSATRYQSVVDIIADGVFILSDKGIVSFMNGAARRMFGEFRLEDEKVSVSQFIPSVDDSFVRTLTHKRLSENSRVLEVCEGVDAAGQRFPLTVTFSAMELEGRRFYMGIAEDDSEKKRVEADLAAQHAALELNLKRDQCENQILQLCNERNELFELLNACLSVFAKEFHFCPSSIYLMNDWDNNLQQVASYGMPGEWDRSFKIGEGLIGQVAKSHKGRIFKAKDFDGPALNLDTGVGSISVQCVVIEPLLYKQQLLGVLSMGIQQTPDDETKEFISKACQQISHAIANVQQFEQMKQLTDRLNENSRRIAQQNKELERNNRLKSEFLANMSHELRTPLNAIIGFSELMKDKVLGPLTPKQEKYSKQIVSSGQHLLSLINDILDLSRIEAGKVELEFEAVNARSLMDNVYSIVLQSARKKKIELSYSHDPSVVTFDGDRRRIHQVLYNLLSNAIKFTPESGVVTFALNAKTTARGSKVVFTVKDNGIGISKNNQQRIFEPFEQSDGSVSREYGGTGLGLALVRRLAELHGGEVFLESELGQGTEVTVELPRGTLLEEAPPEKPRRKLKSREVNEIAPSEVVDIVIIEDDVDLASAFQESLRKHQYQVRVAVNGLDGLKLIEEKIPSLIILDINMPGLDGWEVLSELKKSTWAREIPTVIVSVDGDQTRRKGFIMGAVEVLQKPVRREQLVEVVERLTVKKVIQQSARILVVDDDPRIVEMMSTILHDRGHHALRAYNGADALEILREDPPDLVLLDLMMPEITGLDVIEKLRNDQSTRDLPLVIVTSKDLTLQERCFLKENTSKVLAKGSFQLTDLVDLVEETLGFDGAAKETEA